MYEMMFDFLSPSELYGKLLARLTAVSRASIASLWTCDRGKTFLYANVGEHCDRLHSLLYEVCEKNAGEAISSAATVSELFGELDLLALPIFCDDEVTACALLVSEPKKRFDEDRRALAVKETEKLSEILSSHMLKRPTYLYSPVILSLRDVSILSNDGEEIVPVLNRICLDIKKEELLVVIGTSGSGKSTLLNVIGGLTLPSSGTVTQGELDLSSETVTSLTAYRRDKVSFLFQFINLVPELTAAENVAVSAKLSKNPMPVAEALRLVGMEGKEGKYPSHLSKEDQQRVAIARAIAKDPDFLLCDEPIGALSFEAGKRILSLLTEIIEKTGITVLIVTHCTAIASMADRVVRLKSGQIIEEYVNAEKLSPNEIVW